MCTKKVTKYNKISIDCFEKRKMWWACQKYAAAGHSQMTGGKAPENGK